MRVDDLYDLARCVALDARGLGRDSGGEGGGDGEGAGGGGGADFLLCAAGGGVEAGSEAEAGVVLGEGLLGVPGDALESKFSLTFCFWGVGGEYTYQFAAIIAFPNGFTRLLLGLCFTFGMLDLFFFFWSSRPILAV